MKNTLFLITTLSSLSINNIQCSERYLNYPSREYDIPDYKDGVHQHAEITIIHFITTCHLTKKHSDRKFCRSCSINGSKISLRAWSLLNKQLNNEHKKNGPIRSKEKNK